MHLRADALTYKTQLSVIAKRCDSFSLFRPVSLMENVTSEKPKKVLSFNSVSFLYRPEREVDR